jgi:FkbM family methyltransferase
MNTEAFELFIKRSPALRSLTRPAVWLRRRIRRYRQAAAEDVLDNARRLLVADPVVALREFQGEFAMDGRSDLFRSILETGSYEPRLAEMCLRHLDPERDVIDVGANVGFYTVLLAQRLVNRRVLAIEPSENALARLRSNISRNSVDDSVVVFSGVAADRAGTARLRSVTGREEYSSLGVMAHPRIVGEAYEEFTVPCETIDALVAEYGLAPGFVKLDVEGMEHVVLSGMHGVLATMRPIILIEVLDPLLRQNGSSAQEVVSMIESYGYTVRDPIDSRAEFREGMCSELLCTPAPADVTRAE